MIKVLKEGHGAFKEAFCKYCGCEFAYQNWDVEVYSFTDGTHHLSIDCPACHQRVLLGKMTVDEWLKNGVNGELC